MIVLVCILYILFCAVTSFAIGTAFGLAVQWACVPLFFVGGLFLGRALS